MKVQITKIGPLTESTFPGVRWSYRLVPKGPGSHFMFDVKVYHFGEDILGYHSENAYNRRHGRRLAKKVVKRYYSRLGVEGEQGILAVDR